MAGAGGEDDRQRAVGVFESRGVPHEAGHRAVEGGQKLFADRTLAIERFLMPLNCDGLISICLLRGPFVAWRSLKEASIDRSGNGRSAGLERQPAGAEMRELGIGELIQQFDRLRQQQQRRG